MRWMNMRIDYSGLYTPGKSIRKFCVTCVGSIYDPPDCGGSNCLSGQGNKDGQYWFYPYSLGRGRPSVKLIRKLCLECMGGSSQPVDECRNTACHLYVYRFGKNPKRAGQGDISRLRRAMTGWLFLRIALLGSSLWSLRFVKCKQSGRGNERSRRFWPEVGILLFLVKHTMWWLFQNGESLD